MRSWQADRAASQRETERRSEPGVPDRRPARRTAPAATPRQPQEPARTNEDRPASRTPLLSNLRLDELRQQRERLLPAEIAGFDRNRARYAFLHDAQLGAERNLLQRHGRQHFAGEVRVVELVGVADALVGH